MGVVFLSRNKSFVDELCSYADNERIVPLSLISNLNSLEPTLKCLQPELIVIDDCFSEITAARLAQRIQAFRRYAPPLIIVLSGKNNLNYLELCAAGGVSYFMLKPFMADIFWERAMMLFDERQFQETERRIQTKFGGDLTKEDVINRETMKLLYRIGCQPKGKGFLYLKEAIAMVASNQTEINLRSRDLYDVIGSKFHQSWINIQRNIAIAIKSVNIELTNECFYQSELETIENKRIFSSMEFISLAAYLVCEIVNRGKEDKCYEEC